jgi:hypothetical protein
VNTIKRKVQHIFWAVLEHLVYSVDLSPVAYTFATEVGSEGQGMLIPVGCSSEMSFSL